MTVRGRQCEGSSLKVQTIVEPIQLGTIISIEGVEDHRTGKSAEFVITVDCQTGAEMVYVYPPLYHRGRYQTVLKLPRNGAKIAVIRLPDDNTCDLYRFVEGWKQV